MSRRVEPGVARTTGAASALMTLVVAVTAMVMAAGCATGDPGVRNTAGTVTGSMHGTPAELVAAAERALRHMEMEIRASEATDVDGRVSARTSRGRAVDVRVFEGVDEANRVSVRVGAFGDVDASRGVLRRIERELERGGFDLDDDFDDDYNDDAPEAEEAAAAAIR